MQTSGNMFKYAKGMDGIIPSFQLQRPLIAHKFSDDSDESN